MQLATLVAAPLGFLAGMWCVSAIAWTDMVAPVLVALSVLVAANCLSSAPRAAILAMAATLTPVIARMLVNDSLGIRAMALMLALLALIQAGVVVGRFRETVRALVLQHELGRLAESDSLTGLDNRLAFIRKITARIDAGLPVVLGIADLDGFKHANDTHGHYAGDAILAGVAQRMRAVSPSALSVARLGGDEFALVFDGDCARDQIEHEIAAIRSTVAMPHVVGNALIRVSTCIGLSNSAISGLDLAALMQDADRALYAEKAARQPDTAADRAMASATISERRRWRE